MQTALARSPLLAAAFIVLTLLYAVAVPPFEIHDESGHFAKAAQLAFWRFPSVHEGGWPGAMLPQPLVDVIGDWPADGANQGATQRLLSHMWHDLAAPADTGGEVAFASLAYLGSYPPVFYAPQAIGLRLGGLAGLSPLGQFYAGRLAGGVAAVALVLLGVALMPYGGRAMLVIASSGSQCG